MIVLAPLTGPLFNGPHVEGGGAVNPVPCPPSAMAGCGVSFMGSEERTNVMKKWPRFTRPSLTAGKRRKLNQRALNRRPLLDRSDTSNNRHCVPSFQGTRRDCKKKKSLWSRDTRQAMSSWQPDYMLLWLWTGGRLGTYSTKSLCDWCSMQIRHMLHRPSLCGCLYITLKPRAIKLFTQSGPKNHTICKHNCGQ